MSDIYTKAPEAEVKVMTEAQTAELQALYDRLLPEAQAMYVNYFLARTPAALQEDMKALVEAGITPEPPVALAAVPEAQPAYDPERSI